MKVKAFTLIELLMVIVIIGILSMIAVPKFINLRSDAINAAAQGNLSALRSAVSMYYSNSAVRPELCGPPYRPVAVNAPCYPSGVTALEGLLASPPTWYGNGIGQCYNAISGSVTACYE
jgi:prepilin-type N-terminal cleavage/methylation domain-containing protein